MPASAREAAMVGDGNERLQQALIKNSGHTATLLDAMYQIKSIHYSHRPLSVTLIGYIRHQGGPT